jgi:hypothetical protein
VSGLVPEGRRVYSKPKTMNEVDAGRGRKILVSLRLQECRDVYAERGGGRGRAGGRKGRGGRRDEGDGRIDYSERAGGVSV